MNAQGGTRTSRRWNRDLVPALLAVVVGLSGCGGGGSGAVDSGEDLSSRDYMPAQIGDRWAFEDTDNTGIYLVRVLGSRSTDRGTGVATKSELPGATESIVVRNAQGVWQYPGTDADPIDLVVGPILLLPATLHVGDSFIATDKNLGTLFDFDGDGLSDATSLHADTVVVATESLDTSLGRLMDCLHLRTTAALRVNSTVLGRATTITAVTDDWYATGIGLVKSETLVRDGSGQTQVSGRHLMGYRVGSLRSDSVAPTATAPGLLPTTPVGPSTAVTITFSEDMDVSTLVPALRVLDAHGTVVDGSTIVTGPRGLRFQPAAGWTSGSYSAILSTGAEDLLGNSIPAEQTWPFVIDATAPTLVSTLPLVGAVDVPLASVIELHFDEAVDATSVNVSTVTVIYDGALMTSVDYEVSGATVLLRPTKPLARGKSYRILLDGVTDMVGNRMSDASVAFATDPGRFGTPLPLAGASPDTMVGAGVAAGDVNGDGRADVIADTTVWTGTQWAYGVSIALQRSDGTLGPPVPLVLPDNCSARSMRVNDFDQDGRKDLLIAASAPCGVMLWRQTSAGQLVLDRVLDPTAGLLELADINGDGRPDAVIASSTAIKVWLNLPTGWVLNDMVTLTARPNQLAVGDINGDNRPDIAVSSIERGDAVALMLQGADGHFGAVTSLSNGQNGGSFGVAIGDIDGDGRADLVVADAPGLGVFRQQANGQLAAYQRFDNTYFPRAIHLVDVNGDGRLDVLSAYSDSDLAVFLQQADGSLAELALYPGTFHGSNDSPDEMAIGDVNGDGRADVLLHGQLFVQRPVAVMAQSVRKVGSPASAHGWWDALVKTARGAKGTNQ